MLAPHPTLNPALAIVRCALAKGTLRLIPMRGLEGPTLEAHHNGWTVTLKSGAWGRDIRDFSFDRHLTCRRGDSFYVLNVPGTLFRTEANDLHEDAIQKCLRLHEAHEAESRAAAREVESELIDLIQDQSRRGM